MFHCRTLLVALALVLRAVPCSSDVRLPKILGSRMVLQRNEQVKIWGWADPGEEIQLTCDWLDAPTKAIAAPSGAWRVYLKTTNAGGLHTITIVGRNRIVLEEILFGEVWIASGQSNMEMPLTRVSDAYTGIKKATEEIEAADHPDLRLFQVGNFSSKEPLEDVQSGVSMYGIAPARCQWESCSPKTISTFSSTAYFFARELHKQLQVPVGVIDASWGGTSAEAWMPEAGLKDLGYSAELHQAASQPQQADQKIPSRLYNGMIHPLRDFRIRGVVWYQGEGNVGQADKYRQLFGAMIGQWRSAFGDDFPFYFVQIAPYRYQGVNAALLREAQLHATTVPRSGMVVTMDIGDVADIHPKNKQEVGRRLALWALANDYGRTLVYSGPTFKKCAFADGKARITFDHADGGLATLDGRAPNHFTIAGADRRFHEATAIIDGDRLIVASDKVAEPKAVRYAFTSDATPNLMNKDGLPASSFRTDDWHDREP